jgi:prepilin-type N-terminal cleavage/methylation domain-containing protein
MRWRKDRKRKAAFTLIELMIAIAIIAILAAIALPRFVRARYRAYLSACMLNEKNIATALESYRTDNTGYPMDLATLKSQEVVNSLPSCPSAPGTVYDYEVTSNGDAFTLSCTGFHEHQIQNMPDGYPQYQSGNGLMERP